MAASTTTTTAAELIPPKAGLEALRDIAAGCQACDLWKSGTQTVFGEGARKAEVLFLGEQPGDREDREGHPFVGPSGRLLDEALEEAGIDRGAVYVTNVVKHFKWKPKGKRRIHQKPNAEEIVSCRPWLDAELAQVRPQIVVALGATAAKALLGPSFRVTRQRGELNELEDGTKVVATVHPSSVLRAPDEQRAAARADFVDDLRAVATHLR